LEGDTVLNHVAIAGSGKLRERASQRVAGHVWREAVRLSKQVANFGLVHGILESAYTRRICIVSQTLSHEVSAWPLHSVRYERTQ
jgi:hypothetical protein